MLIDDLADLNTANRIIDLERLAEYRGVRGDFEGSVTGVWIRLDADGTGIVKYKSKEYKTRVIGVSSIPYGTLVELSHANGTYYSSF